MAVRLLIIVQVQIVSPSAPAEQFMGNHVKQSRAMSMIEAATNVAVGYVLAIATQIAVFPVFGLEAALYEHLAIGFVFMAVSLARGYLLRRVFEQWRCR